ncbi:DNA/RNA helicase domain-containing protein [Pleomorphochaeta sp. DL1XJH-081]|uniref:DNA/RNA helicase domain-containing protein n=1 Tax=Pleomorphochaeta sp. DL1XJH-081 TaxID=3409690 RepID=UPI003BB7805A
MLVYQGEKSQFLDDVLNGFIDDKIEQQMRTMLHRSVGASEKRSWQHSMMYMSQVLHDDGIPQDAGVAIEFTIPQSSKRVDFIISGLDDEQRHHAVIVELKQWSEVFPIENIDQLLAVSSPDLSHEVITKFQGRPHTTVHPSYQAYSYKTLISDFNANVQDIPIHLSPCAYLHNYENSDEQDPLFLPHFKEFIDQAPVFCRGDARKLQQFIKQFIRKGDRKQTLVYIENGDIRPSKSLQDALLSMIQGKREFLLIDEQEVVFQRIISLAKLCTKDFRKRVAIISGGPGTGKTVVAINLLVRLLQEKQYCAYVTKNSAPRNVFEAKLSEGAMKKRYIGNLFKGSGAFIGAQENVFGALLVDEAHRLNKQGRQGPVVRGEDQVMEIIQAARLSVFFIDEDQKVTSFDYGSRETIRKWAKVLGAEVIEDELVSQFRCNGSNGYLAWLDNTLQIRDTANTTLQGIDYDFRVLDSPHELELLIREKNNIDGKARLVAGYCWEWVTKKNPDKGTDIEIDGFAMPWNLSGDRTYAISTGSIDQVGCIHTTQGLEFSYVGVIIGADLRYQEGTVITDFTKRAKSDKSLTGLIGPARKGDSEALSEIDTIIRNTYRTLMTRGMKGCYVYCVDPALAGYLKSAISR